MIANRRSAIRAAQLAVLIGLVPSTASDAQDVRADRSSVDVYVMSSRDVSARSVDYLITRLDSDDKVTWTSEFQVPGHMAVHPIVFHTHGDFVLMLTQKVYTVLPCRVLIWNKEGPPEYSADTPFRPNCLTASGPAGNVWIVSPRRPSEVSSPPGTTAWLYQVYGAKGLDREGTVAVESSALYDSVRADTPETISILPDGRWLCLRLGLSSEYPERNVLASWVVDPANGAISVPRTTDMRDHLPECVAVELSDLGYVSSPILEYDRDSAGIDLLIFPMERYDYRPGQVPNREMTMCLLRFDNDGLLDTCTGPAHQKALRRSPRVSVAKRRIVSQGQTDRTTLRSLLIDETGSFEERVSNLPPIGKQ